jgi:hypothetical protein
MKCKVFIYDYKEIKLRRPAEGNSKLVQNDTQWSSLKILPRVDTEHTYPRRWQG